MRTISAIIIFFMSFTISAESQQLANKAMIESFDLEQQIIYLHGKKYSFAPGVLIFDQNNQGVGFTELNEGQVIEFKTVSGDIKNSDDVKKTDKESDHELNNSEMSIMEIKILSDNRSQDKAH